MDAHPMSASLSKSCANALLSNMVLMEIGHKEATIFVFQQSCLTNVQLVSFLLNSEFIEFSKRCVTVALNGKHDFKYAHWKHVPMSKMFLVIIQKVILCIILNRYYIYFSS